MLLKFYDFIKQEPSRLMSYLIDLNEEYFF